MLSLGKNRKICLYKENMEKYKIIKIHNKKKK